MHFTCEVRTLVGKGRQAKTWKVSEGFYRVRNFGVMRVTGWEIH